MLATRWLEARRSAEVIICTALAVAGLALWSDVTRALNRLIEPARFALVHREASRQVVVVEMDAASAAAIKQWPWSRAHYAQVADRLRNAGAASIVFDVDFSSPSDQAGDRAFAASLERAKGLAVLPTFGQQAAAFDARTIDALPIPALQSHAALASVSVAPDSDGIVRDMPFATITAGVPRPSLSAFIASRSGRADETFPIDMSIDPATIPRLSFIAVRDGHFDPSLVRGRHILIGATAIEMGDRYGSATHGVIPGVMIQAIATETLLRGVPTRGSTAVTLGLAVLLAMLVLGARSTRRLALRWSLATTALVGAVCVAQFQLNYYLPLASGLILLTVAGGLAAGRLLLLRFRDLRMIDEATGMPNRRAMAIETPTGAADDWTAVLRIANFENLVAVLGGAEAEMVSRIADRLRRVTGGGQVYRITDRAVAFRLSGDTALEEAMDGLRAIMLQPVEVTGRRFDVAMGVGVAKNPAGQFDRTLSEAARAAETASDDGVFWRGAHTNIDAIERSLTLMGELDQAIVAHQIHTYYQPKLDLRSGAIASAEALVRWAHPERGLVPPDLFVPMAENNDRIGPLTLYVLTRVLTDLRTLTASGHRISIAINISAKLLAEQTFTDKVADLVVASSLPPSALVFEVTESATMSSPEMAIAALVRFRAMGIAVSMDDYGTGQSTLTYLRQLPLSELKIDRSFVQHAHRNRNDALLVKSTIELAHDMKLKVVAEGVEDEECLSFLKSVGCDLVQGYHISRPLPFSQFQDFVSASSAKRMCA